MRRRAAALALAVLLPACGAGARAGERQVVISIEHSRFHPSRITVPAHSTIRFVVHNTDPIDHELIVGPRWVQLKHERGTERHHNAKPGEISIPAGETRSTTYHFGDRESVPFACHLPGHFAYGMRGTVTVVT